MQTQATAFLSLGPAWLSMSHYVFFFFLLRGPEDPLSQGKGPFWVFPLDRVYSGGAKDRAARDILSHRKMKAGKVTPPTGSPEDTPCPGNPCMNAMGAWVSGGRGTQPHPGLLRADGLSFWGATSTRATDGSTPLDICPPHLVRTLTHTTSQRW